MRVDSGYAISYLYACKAVATVERVSANTNYTVGNSHTRNIIELRECPVIYKSCIFINGYACDRVINSFDQYKIRIVFISEIICIIIFVIHNVNGIRLEHIRADCFYTVGDYHVCQIIATGKCSAGYDFSVFIDRNACYGIIDRSYQCKIRIIFISKIIRIIILAIRKIIALFEHLCADFNHTIGKRHAHKTITS